MFQLTPELSNGVVSLRPLQEKDFDDLYLCAGDKRVWAGHPNRDRYKYAKFKQWFASAIENGNALVVTHNGTGQIIGSTRFYRDQITSDAIAIGYTFLSYEHWGRGVNAQLKSLMVDYAFTAYASVWFHISPFNTRSQKAILKLGAEHVKDEVCSLNGGELSPWQFYKITRQRWLEIKVGQ